MHPTLYYDGDCPFCVRCAQAWQARTKTRVDYRTLQSTGHPLATVVFDVDGKEYVGARAVVELFTFIPGRAWMRWVYLFFPFANRLMEWLYKQISMCRECGEKFGWLFYR